MCIPLCIHVSDERHRIETMQMKNTLHLVFLYYTYLFPKLAKLNDTSDEMIQVKTELCSKYPQWFKVIGA